MSKPALRSALICLALALVTAALYAPVAHFDFVNYDDQVYVINNLNINRGLSWTAFQWAFNVGYAGNWHPLTWLSLALDCQLFGAHPGPIHLANLALHITNSVLLFLTLQSLTSRSWPSAFVAAFFAWHPLHVESVAWISERKDVLSCLFFILTIWAYAKYAVRPKKSVLFYLAALVLFALGLMAKPMLVTLPCVLLLLDLWPLRRFSPNAAHLLLLLEKIPFFILAAISSTLTLRAQSAGGALRGLAEFPLQGRFINAAVACWRYLAKLIWPQNLTFIYPYNSNCPLWLGLCAAIGLVVLCAVAVALFAKRPFVLIGWFWFLGTLAPVLGILQVGQQAMADRYTYIPSIGLFIAVCWLVAEFIENHSAARVPAAAFGSLLLIACLVTTRAQLLFWRNGGTLSQHAIDVDPNNLIARSNHAAYLINHGQFDAAALECDEILAVNTNYPAAHEYLGDVLLAQGHPAAAIEQLRWALKFDPDEIETIRSLGEAFLARNQHMQATLQFERYFRDGGQSGDVHRELGDAYFLGGDPIAAGEEFVKATSLNPADARAYYDWAMALAQIHRYAEAVAKYDLSLRFAPQNPAALNNLAWILAANPDPNLRNGPRAVSLAQRAVDLTARRDPLSLSTLGAAYAEAGRFEDAIATAQQAHDLALAQTNHPIANRNLDLIQLYRTHHPCHETEPSNPP